MKTAGFNLMSISYIGYTTTSLSWLLTMHLASGTKTIKSHFAGCHSRKLTKNDLTENTTIMRRESRDQDINRLQIAEALLILASTPIINRQDMGSWSYSHDYSNTFNLIYLANLKKKSFNFINSVVVIVFMIQLFITSRFLI